MTFINIPIININNIKKGKNESKREKEKDNKRSNRI